jgi:hypothetical protein
MRIRAVNIVAAIALVAMAVAACGGALFRQYEYEEEMYLSLDGTATVYVNSSLPALNALRGTSFDTSPTAGVDRSAVRAYFATPHTRVVSVKTSRRSNRNFVHVRLDVDDVRRLADAAPFSWSRYHFKKDDDLFKYEQVIGPAAREDVGSVGWNGREIVAFRMHLPSKIAYHNTGRRPGRGNILAWEQPLADRLRSVPLTLDARMETESILFRTLWLFGLTFMAVFVTFALVIWWVLRRAPAAAWSGGGAPLA